MKLERSLTSQQQVEGFVSGCLPPGITYVDAGGVPQKPEVLAKKIRDAEILFATGAQGSTFYDRSQRDGQWRDDVRRHELRSAIIKSLVEQDRLADDDQMTLGIGGARPKTPIRNEAVAVLLTGLPASGKSSVVNTIADKFGAYVIDPDHVKRMLPEFDGTMMGASLVHDESTALSLGKDYKGLNLLHYCLSEKINFVRPMVGESQSNLEAFRDFLIDAGYDVHLCVIDLPREVAAGRALQRFLKTGRYVSLAYIFDHCANDPALVYYRMRADACRSGDSRWASLGAISTAGKVPCKVDEWRDSPAKLFEAA